MASPDAGAPSSETASQTGRLAAARTATMRLLRWERTPLVLLGVLTLCSVRARTYRLGDPGVARIFDERYYVNAARVILGWHVAADDPYAGSPAGVDPNAEHPPLAKLIIAGSMRLFGDNPLGWRTAPVVFGTLAILLMYWVARGAGASAWASLGAAALMATDTLSLVAGRAAMLDVFTVTFMLLAVGLYLRDRPLLAGLVLGVGVTTKLFGALALLVLLVLEVARLLGPRPPDAPRRREEAVARLVPLMTCAAASLFAYLAALYLMDLRFSTFRNPLVHTRSMLDYGRGLTTHDPQIPASYPWDWVIGQGVIPTYFTSDVNILSGGKTIATHPVYAFRGQINPAVVFLILPAVGLALERAVRAGDEVARLASAWVLGTFVPFVVLAVAVHRTEYLYYMVVVLPGVYLALTRLVSRRWLPAGAIAGYVLLLAYGFFIQYPFRTWPGWDPVALFWT